MSARRVAIAQDGGRGQMLACCLQSTRFTMPCHFILDFWPSLTVSKLYTSALCIICRERTDYVAALCICRPGHHQTGHQCEHHD